MSTNPMPVQASDSTERLIDKIKRILGPTLCGYLAEPNLIEIMLNSDGQLWIERLGRPMEHVGTIKNNVAEHLICSVASFHKQTVNRENPVFEGTLPINGERFEGLLPPVVIAPIFTIRKKASKVFSLAEYVEAKIMTENQKRLIEQAVIDRKNILVVGGTGTGKTTLTNGIIDAIEQFTPEHRIVIIEDTAEIQCNAKNANQLYATETVDMLRLLKATMRLRPDRILVGEVRGAEALALLKAWNTGHPGGVATVHANNAEAGLIRLEQLIAEATSSPMQRLIATAVDLIISIIKTSESRIVEQILLVKDFQDGKYIFEEELSG